MQHEFIRKTGKAIEVLASEILLLNEGDQLPVISDWVERHHFSRGTVQNALHVLRERRAIQTQSRGHLGSYLTVIDYKNYNSLFLMVIYVEVCHYHTLDFMRDLPVGFMTTFPMRIFP